jgi:dCMP deaminase
MAAYAKLNLPKIESTRNEGKKVVIDGLYSWEEYKVLKQQFPQLFILSIQASPTTRYSRLKNRTTRPLTNEESVSRDYSEIENINKAGPISMAEVTILNEGSREELKKEINILLGKNVRPSWDEYFMGITREVSKRATCDRGKSGSVIVKNKRLLSTGYVGSPIGASHCDEVGHQMTEVYDKGGNVSQHCIRTTHAEQNAMVQAARFGIPLDGATIYCKMEPCHICAKMIINAGIKRVVAEKMYHKAQITRDLFREAEIDLVVLNKEVEKYAGQ